MNSERILAGVPPFFSCMIKPPVLTIAPRQIVKIRGPVFAQVKTAMQIRKWAGALMIVTSGLLGIAYSGSHWSVKLQPPSSTFAPICGVASEARFFGVCFKCQLDACASVVQRGSEITARP
jgi:hypothetical protein